jgi:hypothetical protein
VARTQVILEHPARGRLTREAWIPEGAVVGSEFELDEAELGIKSWQLIGRVANPRDYDLRVLDVAWLAAPARESSRFRFRLVDRDGRDRGEREFVSDRWLPGDLLPLTSEVFLRVVAVDYNPSGHALSGTLEVEEVV